MCFGLKDKPGTLRLLRIAFSTVGPDVGPPHQPLAVIRGVRWRQGSSCGFPDPA